MVQHTYTIVKVKHASRTVNGMNMNMNRINEVVHNATMQGHLLISVKKFVAIRTCLRKKSWGSKGWVNRGNIEIGKMGASVSV